MDCNRFRVPAPSCLTAVVAGLVFCAAGVTQAASPSLSVISPQGGQRGTEIEVNFSGARLADAQGLLISDPGINVVELKAEQDNLVKAKLAIAPESRLGIYGIRVRTATGLSNIQTFHVGALPVVDEVEPNSEFETPQKINLDVTVQGVVQNEDVDYYLVEAKKGERITAQIEGLRLGRTFFDPYVSILNAQRFELAVSDDAPLLYQDSLCSIVAPEDGAYIIQVRESAYRGNGACTYRLHVGRYTQPTSVYPAGGKPGEKVQVRWIGDPAGERTEEVTIPADAGEDYHLFAQDQYGIAASGNPFRVNSLDNALEAEPNDEIAQATAASAPGAMNGIIGAAGDADFFKFSATKGQSYHVRVHARSIRSPLDPVLEIYRANGGRLAANDDSGGPDAYARFNVPEDGEFLVKVHDHLGAGGPEYVYRVEVTPVAPQLTMGLPERQQYVATLVEIPKGNRGAVMISASRQDFGGDLNVVIENMPPGMSFETVPLPANQSQAPVIFTAAADAQPAGTLADLIGRPVDANIKVEGHLNQRNWLVRGQGNSEVWSFYDDRMPLALTDAAPFHIEIVQPNVPIVHDGSMQLKVVAKRAEGFDAAIPVRLLYNPPGISSSGSVSIPAGQTEALIPLSANGSAAIGKWKIVAIAQANINGTVEVASPFTELEIAEPLVAFTFPKAAVEQGQEVDFPIGVEVKREFPGSAMVELVGLPAGATTETLQLTKDMKQLAFKIKTADDARVGRHTSVLARVTVVENEEPILHTLRQGELRIDKPLPPKVAAPEQPKPQEQPKPEAVAEKPKERPLTRLEKLRLEREQAGK